MRNPLSAFVDRRRRPRAILWTGVVVLAFAALYVAANMATSTRWFCNDVCHGVHADNKAAYFNASHQNISCMACHYPVDMNPIALALDRADKLADIPPAVLGTTEMPVNKYSHLALSMPATQCTQCHDMRNRKVTPTLGVKIDHAAHAERDITCGACHNRVAHQELEKLTLPGNERHEDFSKMTACFRCHTLAGESPSEYKASGECATCHKPGFDLTPGTHDAGNWYNAKGDSSGHAKAALAVIERTEQASEQWAEAEPEFAEKKPRPLAHIAEQMAGYDAELKVKVPPVSTVNDCYTCHKAKFCSACHGTEVPHKAGFRRSHSKAYKQSAAASCAKCHNRTYQPKYAAQTCQQCHHQRWQPAKGRWSAQHGRIIHREGLDVVERDCERCHDTVWCSQCHTSGRAVGY